MISEVRPAAAELHAKLERFMRDVFEPASASIGNNTAQPPIAGDSAVMEEMKAAARAAGLWNLWLPESEYGAG